MARGEIAEVGGGQSEVEDVGAGDRGAFSEGGHQRFRRRPRIVAYEDAGRSGERDERVPDPARDRLVELVGIDAANVVGLEDDVERSVGHREPRVLTARSGTEIVPGGASGLLRNPEW